MNISLLKIYRHRFEGWKQLERENVFETCFGEYDSQYASTLSCMYLNNKLQIKINLVALFSY